MTHCALPRRGQSSTSRALSCFFLGARFFGEHTQMKRTQPPRRSGSDLDAQETSLDNPLLQHAQATQGVVPSDGRRAEPARTSNMTPLADHLSWVLPAQVQSVLRTIEVAPHKMAHEGHALARLAARDSGRWEAWLDAWRPHLRRPGFLRRVVETPVAGQGLLEKLWRDQSALPLTVLLPRLGVGAFGGGRLQARKEQLQGLFPRTRLTLSGGSHQQASGWGVAMVSDRDENVYKEIYVGYFSRNMYHGQGRVTKRHGGGSYRVEGYWHEDQILGDVTLKYKNQTWQGPIRCSANYSFTGYKFFELLRETSAILTIPSQQDQVVITGPCDMPPYNWASRGKITALDGRSFEGKVMFDQVDGEPSARLSGRPGDDPKHTEVWFPNGDHYLGEVIIPGLVRTGQGRCVYVDQSVYEGQWGDDLWHGHGQWAQANGNVLCGIFEAGWPHGIITFSPAHGAVTRRRYHHGVAEPWPEHRLGGRQIVVDEHEANGGDLALELEGLKQMVRAMAEEIETLRGRP